MSKMVIVLLLFGVCLIGCSQNQYLAKESWIDSKDLVELSKTKDEQTLIKKFPYPFIKSVHNDTTIYFYNFHPNLYKTYNVSTRTQFKPEQNDLTNLWGERYEIIAIYTVNKRIVKMEKNEKYDKNYDKKIVVEKSSCLIQ